MLCVTNIVTNSAIAMQRNVVYVRLRYVIMFVNLTGNVYNIHNMSGARIMPLNSPGGSTLQWGTRRGLLWLRATVVEHWSLTGELSLSCARPAADG